MTGPGIRMLDELDAEFSRVAREEERHLRRGWRAPRSLRRRHVVILAAAVGLLGSAGAGAATGVLPIGAELPAVSLWGRGEPEYTSKRTVVATGRTPIAGRWEMTVAKSNYGFCLGLRLLDIVPPGARGPDLAEGCGGESRFDAASEGGGTPLPDTTLAFGPAPEEATAVRLRAPDGFKRTEETHDGPDDIPGDFYLVEIPRNLRNVLVQWLDEDGRPRGPGVYVPSSARYGRGPKGPQPPH